MAATAVSLCAVLASTDLHAPPRFDGAGYSVLALAIQSGKGYREIASPIERPHGHFPPGYPLVLAGLWSINGRSVVAAHGLSIACTTLAVWLASRWFLTLERRRVAVPLAFALAVNWTWAVNGGVIQSEPLFLLLGMLALMVARRRGAHASLVLGLLLGLTILTRHVGVCLAAAVIIHQGWNKRWRDGLITSGVCTLVILPWVLWLATLEGGETQAGLFQRGHLLGLIGDQALFYARRIPDSIVGPFVEVATVFVKSRVLGLVATLGAIAVTSLMLLGSVRLLTVPRRRLAGLIALLTLLLLLIWPFTEAGRFLVPLVPVLLLSAVESPAFLTKSRVVWLLLAVSLPYPAYALISGRAEAGRRTHAEFDAACTWLAHEATEPGLVISRHPGEVFWQTGRKGVAPSSSDLVQVLKQVDEQRVAYLLIDPERFANAPETPLARLARTHPDRFLRVHAGAVEVYEVRPARGP